MSVVENTPAAWSERAAAGTPWDACLYSERGQTERLKAVLRHLPLEPGDTLLDYGCGPAALCALLPPHVGYWGYDWAEGMVERVRRDQPRAQASTQLPDMLFDHVVCCGPFNLADGWWKQRTWDTLAHLWSEYTRRTLTVSLYRGHDPACLTYSTRDAVVFAETAGCPNHIIDCSYLDNDLLLHLRR